MLPTLAFFSLLLVSQCRAAGPSNTLLFRYQNEDSRVGHGMCVVSRDLQTVDFRVGQELRTHNMQNVVVGCYDLLSAIEYKRHVTFDELGVGHYEGAVDLIRGAVQEWSDGVHGSIGVQSSIEDAAAAAAASKLDLVDFCDAVAGIWFEQPIRNLIVCPGKPESFLLLNYATENYTVPCEGNRAIVYRSGSCLESQLTDSDLKFGWGLPEDDDFFLGLEVVASLISDRVRKFDLIFSCRAAGDLHLSVSLLDARIGQAGRLTFARAAWDKQQLDSVCQGDVQCRQGLEDALDGLNGAALSLDDAQCPGISNGSGVCVSPFACRFGPVVCQESRVLVQVSRDARLDDFLH